MSDDDLDNLSPNPFGIASDESDPINSVFSSPAEMRILVVESFSTMRRIIRNLLTDLGYRYISEAEDGLSALPMLHNQRFDFVITDLIMPRMSGLDLLRAIRADANLSHIPVLMITADAKREQIIEAALAGVNAYMVKPFTAATLESKILSIINSRA
jgi:two-component system chemotaxis response regulator CheY|tara:strand:+ start:1145 stop:1615 length:471 start_codon:yes stop_codon:yes gene_type:complete